MRGASVVVDLPRRAGPILLGRLDDRRRLGRGGEMRTRRQLVIGEALIDLAVALLQRDKIMVGEGLGRIRDAFVGLMPAGEIATLHGVGLAEGVARGTEGEQEAEAGNQGAGHASSLG
jgi:hypothetical protein